MAYFNISWIGLFKLISLALYEVNQITLLITVSTKQSHFLMCAHERMSYHIVLYTVCSKKSDAKIEITITATNLIIIKYPLSSFNYHPSGTNVANFNKIHYTDFEQQLFKNGTQQQKFPIWKRRLSSSYAIPSVTLFVLKVVAICTDICMSLVQTVYFSAAAGRPVCRPCIASICRRSRSSVEQDQSCQEIPPTTFWHCNPYSALKLWSVFRPL